MTEVMCPHPGAGLCFCPATASTQHPSSHSAPALHPRRRSRPETESLTQTYLSCKEFTGSLTEQPREGQLSAPGGRHPLSRFLPRLTHVVTLKRPGPPHTHRPSPASNALLSAPPQTNHTQLSGRGQHGVHSRLWEVHSTRHSPLRALCTEAFNHLQAGSNSTPPHLRKCVLRLRSFHGQGNGLGSKHLSKAT